MIVFKFSAPLHPKYSQLYCECVKPGFIGIKKNIFNAFKTVFLYFTLVIFKSIHIIFIRHRSHELSKGLKTISNYNFMNGYDCYYVPHC